MRICILVWLIFLPGIVSPQSLGVLDYEVTAVLDGSFIDIDVGLDGRVYLLGSEERGVVTMYSQGLERSLAVFDLSRTVGRKLKSAAGIAVASDGSFWVSDRGDGALLHFDVLGFFVGELRWPDKGPVTLKKPDALAMTPGGALVVADRDKGAVVVADPGGELYQLIPGAVDGGIRFGDPLDVAVDPIGYIYVVDGDGGGVCKFDPRGVLRHRWGAGEEGKFRFPAPTCMTFDDVSIGYVIDSEEGRCAVLSGSEVVATFATPGRGIGQIQDPLAVAVGFDGGILVLDQDPGRVQVFSVPSLEEVRDQAAIEDRFLEPKPRRVANWDCGAKRIDLLDGSVAVLELDKRTIRVGDLAGCPGSLSLVEGSGGILKDATDVCLLSEDRLVVADKGHHRLFLFHLDTGVIDEVPCPKKEWKRPHRLSRGADGRVVVWDQGDRSLSFVLGDGKASSIPVNLSEEVVEIVVRDAGDIILFPAKGAPIRMGPSGPIGGNAVPHAAGIEAAAMVRGMLVIGLEQGGIVVQTFDGEQLLLFGAMGSGRPLVEFVVDIAADDSLVLAVNDQGRIGAFLLENIDRSGVCGILEAPEERRLELLLEPQSPEHGGRRTRFPLHPGMFCMEGVLPGLYTWSMEGEGWQTIRGEEPLWLRPFRIASLGTLSLEPAGGVFGSVVPSGAVAFIDMAGPDSLSLTIDVDSSGSFAAPELPPGDYELTLNSSDFKPDSSTYHFAVQPGVQTKVPTIKLTRLGSLKGVIKPLTDDVEVWVLKSGRLLQVCRPVPYDTQFGESSDSLGRYSCDGLDPDEYKILFRARGFYPDTLLEVVSLAEGVTLRCGAVILHKAPEESEAGDALRELQLALADYSGARFARARERTQRLLARRLLPYSSIERAATLLGWCLIAQGGDEMEEAVKLSVRLALLVNPWVEPGPEASPRVTQILERVRAGLFGEGGPPEGIFRP